MYDQSLLALAPIVVRRGFMPELEMAVDEAVTFSLVLSSFCFRWLFC